MTPPIESTTPPPSKSALLSIPQLKQLDRKGFVQIPNAFSRNSILEARAAAIDLYKSTSFSNQNSPSVRQDTTTFISDISSTPVALRSIIRAMRSVASELDSADSTDFSRTTSHRVPLHLQLAVYDGERKEYRAHRDNPVLGSRLQDVGLLHYLRSKPYRARGITCIVYLNSEDWNVEESGGGLEVFLGADEQDDVGETSKHPAIVSPVGGTMVLFDSRVVLHRVMPMLCTGERRIALTLWIEGEPRSTA
ncbi:hypothetical protein TrVE_jg9854 [Triparma verrucosa]|uniref:Fe2OG dioxygenase domain-containing protein n=1 Tax=Triparma verrucosa TaxID=1606542 RepID=A0A9W7FHL8_9STRA|nr:hypothetical protein TrVE_jg9854 [Triparma verrucosa]